MQIDLIDFWKYVLFPGLEKQMIKFVSSPRGVLLHTQTLSKKAVWQASYPQNDATMHQFVYGLLWHRPVQACARLERSYHFKRLLQL